MENLVLRTTEDRISWLTLNRPEKRNALSYQMVAELKQALKDSISDALVKVIVIRGNEKAFVPVQI